jgi:integrase
VSDRLTAYRGRAGGEALRLSRSFKRQWVVWLPAAKLQPSERADGLPVRWYDATRHTFATSLLNGSWGTAFGIEDVSAFLGHANIADAAALRASCLIGSPR